MSFFTQLQALIAAQGAYAKETRRRANEIRIPLGCRWNIDNQANDLSGWGPLGPYYSTTTDLGSITSTNLARTAGGFELDVDVKINRIFLDFYQNDATMGVNNWGWLISRFNRARPGNTVNSTTFMYDERTLGVQSAIDSAWAGANGDLRQYNSTQNQYMDLDLTGVDEAARTVPALDTINIAVFHNGTADANNRYIQGQAGFILAERV